jgi:hypothetical protein
VNNDLESRLREALAPLAPRNELTEKLIAGVTGKPAPDKVTSPFDRPARRTWQASTRWWPVGLAAAVLVGVGIQQYVQQIHEREVGFEARRQVVLALRMTSQKLDLAYRAVRAQTSSDGIDRSGI